MNCSADPDNKSMFCSNVFSMQDNNLINEFKDHSDILCRVDLIMFDWDDHLDAKEAYNKLMQNEKILKLQETSGYYPIQYDGDPNVITIMPKLLNNDNYKDIIIDAVKTADCIKFWEIIVDEDIIKTPNFCPHYVRFLKEKGYKLIPEI